jgi:MFS family permease
MTCAAPLVASIPLVRGMPLVLLAVVALSGLAIQAYRPAAAVLLAELMPEQHKVMGFSMMRIALNIGAAVAPLLAAVLIQVNWDLLFWLDGATAALWALLAFMLLPKRTATRHPAGSGGPSVPAMSARAVYGTLVRDTRFLCYLVAGVFGMIVYAGSLAVLPLDIVSAGYPVGLYSTVLVISSVVLITCELKITTYIVRIPKYLAGLFGNLVSGLGFVCYGLLAAHPFFVMAGALLAVSGLMIHGPSTAAHPATFPVELRSRYIATKETLSGLAATIGPMLGLFIWSQFGGSAFWAFCALLSVTAGTMHIYGLRPPPAPIPVPEPEPTPEVVGERS